MKKFLDYKNFDEIYNLKKDNIKIIFVGDIMLSNYSSNHKPHIYNSIYTPGKLIKKGIDPFSDFAELFKKADITIGNLECCITTTNKPIDKPYVFKANPRVIPLLKKYFNALSIANNHSYDYGEEGFNEMITLLKNNNLPYFGGGKDIYEALEPVIFNIKNIRIAILGYNNSIPNEPNATEYKSGSVWATKDNIKTNIIRVKNIYEPDYIIVFMHWGDEYEKIAKDEEQILFGHLAIDSGADIVIGSHPHVTQNIEIYNNKPIFYSLGNFLFHGFADQDTSSANYDTNETSTGWALELNLTTQLKLSWKIHIARLDQYGIPIYSGEL